MNRRDVCSVISSLALGAGCLASLALGTGCSTERSTDDAGLGQGANAIALPGENFYPEGVAVANDGTLYVGSLGTGRVVSVRPGAATAQDFVSGGVIAEASGMVVDEGLGLLWVCDSGLSSKAPAVVGVARADGRVVVRHGFPDGAGLCNDVALDGAGNLYATDSFLPRIVQVAAGRRLEGGSAQVWATDSAWQVGPGQFGLNGIVGADQGLYVAHTQGNAVFHVPIGADGAAGAVRKVPLDRVPNGLDGLEVARDGGLIFVEGFANRLTHIALQGDGGGRLQIVAEGLAGPTTFALVGGDAWVAEGQLSFLFDPSSGQPSLPFRLVRVGLEGAARP
jgi:sugar lactone lactonase YvrE